MSYRPQSPDLSSYAPQSPDLSGYRPQSPDLSGLNGSPKFPPGGSFNPMQTQQRHAQHRYTNSNGFGGYGPITSNPQFAPQYMQSPPHPQEQQRQQFYQSAFPQQQQQQPQPLPPTSMGRIKRDPMDDEFMPDAIAAPPAHRGPGRPRKNPLPLNSAPSFTAPALPKTDPTLGITLKTSFPVARIKRIMQADEDIGKVAQVTPHVVSRALELFMIQLISASANHARGGGAPALKSEGSIGGKPEGKSGGGASGPRRILAQHMKKAVLDGETFDFLADIVSKIPDAPSARQKKETAGGSESDDGAVPTKGRKGGGRKKRKDSADDF